LGIFFSNEASRLQAALALTPFQEWTFPDGTLWTRFYRTGEGYLLRFPDLGDFDVSADGCAVRAWPAPGISEDTMQHLYLNQVLPLALSKQGKIVFHASAVDTGNGAIAFLGESGRGKSTLAASFASGGQRFLTDDALLLDPAEGGYLVQPSHPSIRLWDDSQEALLAADAELAPPVQYTPKARILSGDGLPFCNAARQLRRVYFLGDGSAEELTIQRMRPSEAMIGLVRNSFLLDIEAHEMLSSHFDLLAKMVALPIYYHLDYPRAFAALPSIRQGILEHATEEDEID
jgi:hypothetical protein